MTRLPHIAAVLSVVALSSSSIVKSPSNDGNHFELLILHNNDMHARFEQTSQLSGACTVADREAGKCYGGFPRVAHVVKEARKAAASGEGPPVLYLNAGDTYTGTAWFTIYKWKVAAEFLNALQPDAVSLGNNDLEKGSNNLTPFLANLDSIILASNVILNSDEAKLKIKKSIIIEVEGVKIGIVGYLTPNSNILDSTGNVEYIDEVIAVQDEVNKLKQLGIKIIIALGQSETKKDVNIATEVDGIDLVIAGHQNIFFSNGTNAEDNFDNTIKPIVVSQKSGKQVPIVQSYAYNKYLGRILLVFNAEGEITKYQVDSILLDQSVPQNIEIAEIVTRSSDQFVSLNATIGNTLVDLDGDTCGVEECNLGNLVLDSVILYYAARFKDERWTDAPVAIINGGAFTGTISPESRPFPVSRADILTSIPESQNLVAVTMNGTVLKQVLEHSVSDYRLSDSSGRFLQFSGIRVTYDLAKEPGSRVVNVVVRCWDCLVPQFFEIDNRNYKILMPASLANGNNGYDMLVGLPKEELSYDAVTCTTEYIGMKSPIYPEIAERSLGNHEFDNGVSGLTPFIRNLTCPVLAANLILNKEPSLESEHNLMKSVVININGTKVGVIGYLTPETKVLAVKNNVEYIDEVIAIKEEVKKLKKEGVNILIALGHSGFLKDLEIAKKVEDIDLVIGGHTNTFLWNGTTPDSETIQGPYPTIVEQESGRIVAVVQAYAYTKYLGKLHVLFNSNGEIDRFDGNPVLLNSSVPQDPTLLEIVNRYSENIIKISDVIVGTSLVTLDGLTCRLQECNLGNLIADAIVDKYASEYKGDEWSDAPIAIVPGGGIRASVSHEEKIINITKGELLTVMPFDGNIVKVTLNGSNVIKMLEYSVSKYNKIRAPGKFLQLSGLKAEYDFKRPPGKRLIHVEVMCGKCKIPSYAPVNMSETYNILMNNFLSMGGDGFSLFLGLPSSLGNHEFDHGVNGLTPFIKNLSCPVVAANLVLTKVPDLEKETNLRKSIILNVNGTSVGVIGYLTPDTKMLAVKNDVEYIDEIAAIKEEVKKLKAQGVNIIIGLGHSGYLKDLEIAREVDGLNLVIGGHSNTFLWNGTCPDSEKIQGPYPTYVTQSSGKRVPVVQAYAYTKYLGSLHMVFNSKGDLLSADGNPILLDKTTPQDPDALKIIQRYRTEISNYTEEVIGKTSIVLDGLSCQHQECNMGNLIADAMVYNYAMEYEGKEHWTDAPIAIIQGGGIRSSIANSEIPTTITKGDLIGVLPFEGDLVIVTMTGNVLMQMLEHSSLGNHEFDEEVDGVIPFIRNLTSPVLAANLILTDVPELEKETNLYKSIVIIKNGIKIGIIGYLTPETKFLAPKNKVNYEDEVVALKREVHELKEMGIKIFIALGHSGFLKDLEIAKEVEELDIVIGGHSNTFLINKNSTDEIPEYPQGPYPTIVRQKTGRKVLVVQAYAYTKYLGKLHLMFDEQGEILYYDGEPILLNREIPEDPELLQIVNRYRTDINKIYNEVVGTSLCYLDGDSCRLKECNLGNFINDAIIKYTKQYSKEYSNVNIAITQGGRIRSSIDGPNKPFKVTRGDMVTVIPFSDTLCIMTMNGTILRQALEHSVAAWRRIDTPGQFLQYSGVQIVYDLAKEVGSRVVKANAICSNCSDLSDVSDNLEYKVITSVFLAEGGDGYTMFDTVPKEIVNYNEVMCAIDYLQKYSPIEPIVTMRINILNADKIRTAKFLPSQGQSIKFNTSMIFLLTMIILFS
ncbi:uncharacterized protein LOC126771897 [Nymphalis io]|uniref:uncharacterized protein LOC126771897 n=1 Tax=Inachis io TaxID=171585 RepID=UPI0021686DE7|nr:uncharacterized protein LOC126771897 [Nymphalis io]